MPEFYHKLIKPLYFDIRKLILDVLFPKFCLGCEAEGGFLCLECKATLTPVQNQHCIICHKPAPFGLTHSGCLTPYGAEGQISFFDYHDEKVANLLIKGKYSFLPEIYEILGEILAKKIRNDFSYILNEGPYKLVPIPLHPFRSRWRGFNQAEVLCNSLEKHLGLPVINPLIRKKPTQTQKDLMREQRITNVQGAFTLSPNFQSFNSQSFNCILVDDVTTTGSTLLEAAKVLKRNGAKKVICLTVARD